MLNNLKIKTASGETISVADNLPSVRTAGMFSQQSADNNMLLSCRISSGYADWYSDFIERKASAMLRGGGTNHYMFSGLMSEGSAASSPLHDWSHCVRSIQGSAPAENGAIELVADKYIDVSIDPAAGESHGLIITRTSDFFEPNYYYVAIQRILMYLYDSINYQADRLRLAESDIDSGVEYDTVNISDKVYPIVKLPYAEFGPRLNTVGNYQAVVARWNHYAWKSSMVMDIESSASTCSISIGYVCLDCFITALKITATLTYMGLYKKGSDDAVDTAGGAVSTFPNTYTIYHMGSSTTVSKNVEKVVHITRNGDACDGTGYMGGSVGDRLEQATIDLELLGSGFAEVGGQPVIMRSEQAYYETFSIAVPSGSLEYYSPQTDTAYVHRYTLTTTWFVDGREGISKTAIVDVPAVNVRAVGEPDEPDPTTPDDTAAVEYGVLTGDGKFQKLSLSSGDVTVSGDPVAITGSVKIYNTGAGEPAYGDL